jgi:hypothetical protein
MVGWELNKYSNLHGNGSYKINTDSDKMEYSKWNSDQIDLTRTYKILEEMLF